MKASQATTKLLNLGVFIGVLYFTGCCHENIRATAGPEKILDDYVKDLKNGRTKQALTLVSTNVNPRPSESELQQFVVNAGSSLSDVVDTVISKKGVSLRWTMVLPDGREIVLVKQKNAWKVSSGPVLPGWAMSARQALVEFAGAIQRRDCKAIISFAPPEIFARYSSKKIEKGCTHLLKSLKTTSEAIKKNLDSLTYLSENKAELSYGKNAKVILEKKDGRWFIQDL